MVVVGGGTGGQVVVGLGWGGGGRVRATYHTNVWKKVHVTFKLDKLPYYDLFPVVSMDCRLLVFVRTWKKKRERVSRVNYVYLLFHYYDILP